MNGTSTTTSRGVTRRGSDGFAMRSNQLPSERVGRGSVRAVAGLVGLATVAAAAAVFGAAPASAASAPGDSYQRLAITPSCGSDLDGKYRCSAEFTSSGYVHAWDMGTTSPITVLALGAAGGAAADGTPGGAGGGSQTDNIGLYPGMAAYRIALGGVGDNGRGMAGGAGGAGGGGRGGSGINGGQGGGGGGGATVVTASPSLRPDPVTGGVVVAVGPGGGGGSSVGARGGDARVDGSGYADQAARARLTQGAVSAGKAGTPTSGGAAGTGSVDGEAGSSSTGGAGATPSAGQCVRYGCMVAHPYNGGGGGGGGAWAGGGGGLASLFDYSLNLPAVAGGGGGGAGTGFSNNFSTGSARARLNWTVDKTRTTTNVSLSSAQIGFGGTVQAAASVTLPDAPSIPVSDGMVQFSVDGIAYGQQVAVRDGKATVPVTLPGRAAHQVTATYSGRSLLTSTSQPVQLNVGRYTTHATLFPNPITGAVPSVNLKALLPRESTGTVTFLDGSTPLGTAPVASGSAEFLWFVTPGTHSITASYSGDVMNLPSTSPAMTYSGWAGQTYLGEAGQSFTSATEQSITVQGRSGSISAPVRMYLGISGVDMSHVNATLVSPTGVTTYLLIANIHNVNGPMQGILTMPGQQIGGTWTLKVSTDQPGLSGTIDQWSMTM